MGTFERAAKKLQMAELMGWIGFCLISYGTWRIYPPAGFIVCGTLLFTMTLLEARGRIEPQGN